MLGDIGSFTSVFSPQIDQVKSDKIISDILNLCFAVVSAGAFNSCQSPAASGTETKQTTNSWPDRVQNASAF
jgi:hypothetical protein